MATTTRAVLHALKRVLLRNTVAVPAIFVCDDTGAEFSPLNLSPSDSANGDGGNEGTDYYTTAKERSPW